MSTAPYSQCCPDAHAALVVGRGWAWGCATHGRTMVPESLPETACRECGVEFAPDLGESDCPVCHLCFSCAAPDCPVCGPCAVCGRYHDGNHAALDAPPATAGTEDR